MIDKRFSLAEFDAHGRNSEQSDALATELQVAIAAELLPGVRALGEDIARKLRQLGHAVTELDFEVEEDSGAISVTFVDTSEGDDRQNHRLRFDLDVIVSAGFPRYSDSQTRSRPAGR